MWQSLICKHVFPKTIFLFLKKKVTVNDSWVCLLSTINSCSHRDFETFFDKVNISYLHVFQIPAVHDFGLFMALIVANCWITVMLTMPAALYLWQLSIRRFEEKIFKCLWVFILVNLRSIQTFLIMADITNLKVFRLKN